MSAGRTPTVARARGGAPSADTSPLAVGAPGAEAPAEIPVEVPGAAPVAAPDVAPRVPAPDLAPVEPLGRGLRWTIWASALGRVLLALFVTDLVLVDDAYIHLRYARHLWTTGEFVYNPGQAVFGLTSPSYGLLCTALVGAFGRHVELAVVAGNALLWALVGLRAARMVAPAARPAVVGLLCVAPVFVDNALLGMESPLFALTLVAAVERALRGDLRSSAGWTGLALVTRPEAVLLTPVLLTLAARGRGLGAALRELARPSRAALLLGPGLAWCAFALARYGTVVPQSMVAKSGWNNAHYDGLVSWGAALLAVPRLVLVPFVDALPAPLPGITAALALAAVAWVVAANVRRGDAASRAWCAFLVVYLAFYLVGKGATEASWYAVPSSVAFLLASPPALPRGLVATARGRRATFALLGLTALASVGAAFRRAPLLHSYVEGYGANAAWLEAAHPDDRSPVVIGEIGVYGWSTSHPVVDVGALVSPEVLPWKNEGASFCEIVRRSGARWFVLSDRNLETNRYPSVGVVRAGAADERWFAEGCREVARFRDKRTFEVLAPGPH